MRVTLSKAIVILALGISFSTTAADLPTRHFLTLQAAKLVIAAAEAEALQKGWPCVVAVTDSAGYLIGTRDCITGVIRQHPAAATF